VSGSDLNQELKELVNNEVTFSVSGDSVVMFMNMDVLIRVALMAFERAGLIYTYEIDPVKRLIKVKIPSESLRGFIDKVTTDKEKALMLQKIFSLRDVNRV